jgi:hypothetical protein
MDSTEKSRVKKPVSSCGWLFLTIFAIIAVNCVQQNNPWDPLNYRANNQWQNKKANAQKDAILAISSLVSKSDSLNKLAAFADAQFSVENLKRSSQSAQNSVIQDSNAAFNAQNARVDTAQVKSCSTEKTLLGRRSVLDSMYFSFDFVNSSAFEKRLSFAVDSIAQNVNSQFSPDTIIFKGYEDSIRTIFDNVDAHFQKLLKQLDSTNKAVDSINIAIVSANAAIDAENSAINNFNNTIKTTFNCGLPVDSADSIAQRIPNLKPGDTLLIATGIFDIQVNARISGTPNSHIVIKGSSSPDGTTFYTTTKNASSLLLDSAAYVDIININFSSGPQDGVLIEDYSDSISFLNCSFVNNKGNGIYILDSYVSLKSCRFLNNSKSGIEVHCNPNTSQYVAMENVLAANNRGYGINGLTINSTIVNATVANNDSGGIILKNPLSPVTIKKSIVASNTGYGIYREASSQGAFVLENCDVFANSVQNVVSFPPYDSFPSIMYEDPQFIDPANNNYSIGTNSAVPDSLGYKD